ncbi:MAG: ATP-grasp domain-containing protein [bacterium]|nr:ATP-grasp domain-containing protein [bacterium]
MNILITAVGGDLGQSAIKCLRDLTPAPTLIGCDMNPYAAGRAVVDTFLTAPPVRDKKRYLDFLRTTCETHNIDYVFPMSDIEIIFYNAHRETFKSFPAVFIVNEASIIETFMDKYHTIKFFESHSIACPKTYRQEKPDRPLEHPPFGVEFPFILKPRRGSGSMKMYKITDAEEMNFYLKRSTDMVIQEYIPGEDNEYTSGLFSNGEKHFHITFKRQLAPGGFSQQVELVKNPVIDEFLDTLARALNFRGSVNVQFRLTERGCMPFEINPRFSSTVYFRHMFGFTDILWSLAMEEGKDITYRPVYNKGIGVKKHEEVLLDVE